MIALEIKELKVFTKQLFIGTMFDLFLVREAEIVTFNRFLLDGKVRKSYYSDEEKEMYPPEEYSRWNVLKPFCFSLIKGNKLPESFRIVLELPPETVQKFLENRNLSAQKEWVQGLYLNIRYEEQKLHCITGVSMKQFTLDKTLEREWEEEVKKFLQRNEIFYEEC